LESLKVGGGNYYFPRNFVINGHGISHLYIAEKSGNFMFVNEWESRCLSHYRRKLYHATVCSSELCVR